MKIQAAFWEKILAIHVTGKGLVFMIHEEQLCMSYKEKNSSVLKNRPKPTGILTRENMKAHKGMSKYSALSTAVDW